MRLVEAGRMVLSTETDIPTFLLSDGKLNGKPVVIQPLTLQQLFDDFFANLPSGNLEESTVNGMHVHKRHLLREFGPRFPVQKLTLAQLQDYASKRSKQPGIRGRKVGANTINKEIVTFQGVWKWAVQMGVLEGRFFPESLC